MSKTTECKKEARTEWCYQGEYNRLDDIVEDDNEEESDKGGKGVDRGDAAAAALITVAMRGKVKKESPLVVG